MDTDPHTVFRVLRSYGVASAAAREFAHTHKWQRIARVLCYATTRRRENFAGFVVSAIRWEWEVPFLSEFELAERWQVIVKEHGSNHV